MSRPEHPIRSVAVAACALLLGCSANAQGDGPRTMLMAPTGLNVITPAYLALGTNFNFQQDILIKGADISTNVVPVTYIRFFGIKGHFAQVWVTPIWGTISGKVKAGEQTIELPDLNGFADPYVAMRVGLIGAPALGLEDFKKHAQKFQLSALIGANMPLGDYEQERPVNLGTNRWAIRIGAPMVLPFGKNPAQLYFLEMTPSLMLYTKNTEAFGGSERTQEPMFVLENHLSHNITKKFWACADLRLQEGGETHTDGADDDNRISQLGGGGTLGYSILPPLGVQVSYGSIFTSNGGEGDMIRARITMMF